LGDHQYRYRVWLPPNYSRLHRWPVILFLHGSGERGDDNLSQLNVGLAPALERFGDRYKAIVLFPQCLDGKEWYGDMESQALAALEQTIREFHGDRSRVYLTGISMGGAGVWYMSRHRHLFAAVAPVCGEVTRQFDDPFPSEPPPDLASILGAEDPFMALGVLISAPVWAFHGTLDDQIPVTQSRKMIESLRRLGKDARYTEYGGIGHDSWDLAYADPDLPRWMLEQRLR
jgi:predicted peptidase